MSRQIIIIGTLFFIIITGFIYFLGNPVTTLPAKKAPLPSITGRITLPSEIPQRRDGFKEIPSIPRETLLEKKPAVTLAETMPESLVPFEQYGDYFPPLPAPSKMPISSPKTPTSPPFISSFEVDIHTPPVSHTQPPTPSVSLPSVQTDPFSESSLAYFEKTSGIPFPTILKRPAQSGKPPETFDGIRAKMIQAGIIKEGEFKAFISTDDMARFQNLLLDYQLMQGTINKESADYMKTFFSNIYGQMK